MDKILAPETPANCSPAFSIAGAMPGASQMTWKTSFPNPDALISPARPAGHGPVFSVAGVIPGTPEVTWRTAMPDPSRDCLDANGHVVTKLQAAARAEVAARRVLAIEARKHAA